MRRIFTILVMALLLASCSNKENLKGILPDGSLDGQKAYLYTIKDQTSTFEVTDSAMIADGQFSFIRPEVIDTALAYIYIPSFGTTETNRILFVNEKGNIEIILDPSGNNIIKGAFLNTAFQTFRNSDLAINAALRELSGTDDETEAKADSLLDAQSELILKYIKPNMHNLLGEYFFTERLASIDVEDRAELLANARPDFREAITMVAQALNTQETLVGKRFLDIKGKTPEGKTISLSDYAEKGKIVLVDFWASWCPPCRRDMPFIVSLYAKYKDQGLEIVGVSLDEKKDAWTRYIGQANMTWVQMSDLKGWDSYAVATYKIESIPYTVLIGKDGTIIAEYLSGQDLEEKIIESLK